MQLNGTGYLGGSNNIPKQLKLQLFANSGTAVSARETKNQTAPLPQATEDQKISIYSGKIGSSIQQYYQHMNQLADDLTYTEERLKFLQEKYESCQEDANMADQIKEELEKAYQDMSYLVDGHLGMQNGLISLSEKTQGKKFSQALTEQLGDMISRTEDMKKGLQGAASLEEALTQLHAAKEQAVDLAQELAGRYKEITSQDLEPYEYRTNESFQGQITDNHIYNRELSQGGSFEVYTGNASINHIKPAVNLLDQKA